MLQYFPSHSGSSSYDTIIRLVSYVQVWMRRCHLCMDADTRGGVAEGSRAPVVLGGACTSPQSSLFPVHEEKAELIIR